MRKRSKGAGSSPLTRGKPGLHLQPRLASRLIPAHAGKTLAAVEWAPRGEAHPRSRGENLKPGGQGLATRGSSPLTRGKLFDNVGKDLPFGLIPAHAGKTCMPSALSLAVAAHPRSRGENSVAETATATQRGSSPLTRGKLNGGLEILQADRLIPAHAGKTTLLHGRR